MAIMETVLEIPAEHERNIFGNFDSNIKKIEKNLNMFIIKIRGDTMKKRLYHGSQFIIQKPEYGKEL